MPLDSISVLARPVTLVVPSVVAARSKFFIAVFGDN
jgi:hypothetical protein